MTGVSDAERKGHKRKLADALQPILPAHSATTSSHVTVQVRTVKLTHFELCFIPLHLSQYDSKDASSHAFSTLGPQRPHTASQ